MTKETTQNLFVGALISSLVGAILLLATDFGGWYNYSPGGEVWGWIGFSFSNFTGFIVFGAAAGALFFCSYVSYLKLSSKPVPGAWLKNAFYGSLGVFALALFGGLYFIIEMSDMDPTNWWFDAGFYAGTIGAGLTALFLHLALQDSK